MGPKSEHEILSCSTHALHIQPEGNLIYYLYFCVSKFHGIEFPLYAKNVLDLGTV